MGNMIVSPSAVKNIDSKVGDPSSASAVTGSDAFSKINTLNNKITVLDDFYIGSSSGINGQSVCEDLLQKCLAAGKHIAFGVVQYNGYSYIAIMYANSAPWATCLFAGYSGETWHFYKQNGNWIGKIIHEG